MSDTVDNVLNSVEESEPSEDVVVSEAVEPVEEAPVESDSETKTAGEAPVEGAPVEEAPVEEAPVEEESEPVPEEVEEPESVVEPVAEPEPVSTQEVVQNVQEILSSTETNVSGNDLENRVKVLEERLEEIIGVLSKQPNGMGGFIYQ